MRNLETMLTQIKLLYFLTLRTICSRLGKSQRTSPTTEHLTRHAPDTFSSF